MKTVFYCFGAYVGQINGVTEIGWWPEDPVATRFPIKQLIPTDLAKTPSAAKQGTIPVDQIQCDDNRSIGGLTTVGPRFPGGQMIGAIWLSETYWSSLGANKPAFPAPTEYDYESTMVMYWGELGDRSFNGFHAQIVAPPQGSLVLVDIWNGGTAKTGGAPAGRWWIDLAAVSDPNYTKISPTGPQAGALFLDRGTITHLPLFIPKKPPGFGRDSLTKEE